jgi:hypothetical protein
MTMRSTSRRHLPALDPANEKACESAITITEQQAGIWKVKTASSSFLGAEELKDDVYTAPFLFWRLAKDIFNISPRLVIIWLIYQAWLSFSGSFSLYLANNLLKSVSHFLNGGIGLLRM